ncbi:hypothetical protein ABD83_07670 [Bacillus xiamenensis]|uniref:Uncharacterized protein n=1 Tax=Bacillus xiamenensis TaxID=1178537 RepID=A0ABT4EWW4_9BACI|nr:hypothetical protein [Bacillus xiamenensis]MBG9911329.1 hypothetical protein [Bacillus xiamenensis]MCY9574304.1 hypothetical protein [Bacillus xiamenensis]
MRAFYVKITAALLSILLVTGLFSPAIKAEDTPKPNGKMSPLTEKAIQQVQESFVKQDKGTAIQQKQVKKSFKVDKKNGVSIKRKAAADGKLRTSAVRSIDGLAINQSAVLNEEDPIDLWFLSTSSPQALISRITSPNADYFVQLFVVDFEADQAYPTDLIQPAGSLLGLTNLPAGDYAFGITSGGDFGDSYTLQVNAKNPPNFTGAVSLSSTLQYFVAEYENGDVFANGAKVYNNQSKIADYQWERVFYFSYDGKYEQRTHSISSVKVKSISAPVSYSAPYASSSEAILVYLDVETLFMYHQSSFASGQYYHDTFVDTLGKTTPRRLDIDDLTNYGDHILAVDLKTGKPIDFFSVLNFYYAAGIEKLPTIKTLN